MADAPKDKSGDPARVVSLDEYRKSKDEPLTAPSSAHPAARALKKKEDA